MAARNKKGKVHGIFKSEFHISFFHKPSMETNDIYHYIVLNDVIFMKMRLIYDIVLVIEEIYPLTSSYITPEYEKLFNVLKDQTVVTVVVSLLGDTTSFRQTCLGHDTPVIEEERFLNYPQNFYNKYKNYCGNNAYMFGFFLIALKDETFDVIEKTNIDNNKTEKTSVVIEPEYDGVKIETEIVDSNIEKLYQYFSEIPNFKDGMKINKDNDIYSININDTILDCYFYSEDSDIYITKFHSNGNFIQSFDILNGLSKLAKMCDITVYILNVRRDNRIFDFLNSEWSRVINGMSVTRPMPPTWDLSLASFCTK